MTHLNTMPAIFMSFALLCSCGPLGKFNSNGSLSSRNTKVATLEASANHERTESDIGSITASEFALDGSKCVSVAASQAYESIGSVVVDTDSVNVLNTAEFTSKQLNPTPKSLIPGAHVLALTPKFPGFPYDEYWGVWIDGNGDGKFDITENLLTGVSRGRSSLSKEISIPNSPGKKTMRVAMRWGAAPAGCGNYPYGEVKDYAIEILPIPSTSLEFGSLRVLPEISSLGVSAQVDAVSVMLSGNGCKGDVCWGYQSPSGVTYKPNEDIIFKSLRPGTYTLSVKLLTSCPSIAPGQKYFDCTGSEIASSLETVTITAGKQTEAKIRYLGGLNILPTLSADASVVEIGASGSGCNGDKCWGYQSPSGSSYNVFRDPSTGQLKTAPIKIEQLQPGTYTVGIRILKATGEPLRTNRVTVVVKSGAATDVVIP